MKSWLKEPKEHKNLILTAIGILIFTMTVSLAYAAFFPIPESLCGVFQCPEGATGVDIAKSLVGRIVDNVRFLIGAS